MKEGLHHLQLKSSLVVLPLVLCNSDFLNAGWCHRLMKFYIAILTGGIIYCLIIAFINYSNSGNLNDFTYFQLVSPFNQHAIQFSLLTSIALLYLLEMAGKGTYYINSVLHFVLLFLLIVFILLLSSKLIIVCTAVYLCYYLIRNFKKSTASRLSMYIASFTGLLLIVLVLATQNPIKKRFNEIIDGNIELVQQDKFTPGTYFNGLQFRLLQWRFVKDILNERSAWITGIGPGETQEALDNKYKQHNMYVGNGKTNNGYLGYNAHNQFLESILQTGVFGLAAFILFCYGLIQLAWRAKNSLYTIVTILFLANIFIESIFETQYGLVIYTFFPLFLYKLVTGKKE